MSQPFKPENFNHAAALLRWFNEKNVDGKDAVEVMLVAIGTIVKFMDRNDPERMDNSAALIGEMLRALVDLAKHVPMKTIQ